MTGRLLVAAVLIVGCGTEDRRPEPSQEVEDPALLPPAPSPPALVHHRSIASGIVDCAVRAGQLSCWGWTPYIPAPPAEGDREWIFAGDRSPVTLIPMQREPRAVAVGDGHVCVLRDDGTVSCSGHDRSLGLLGGDTCWFGYERDHIVNLLAPATDIAVDDGLTCVLLEDRRVQCWGPPSRRSNGICGPQLVELASGGELRGCVRMDAGACVDASGDVWVWGAPGGRVGADALRATRAEGLGPARDVALAGEGVCVIDHAQGVACALRGASMPVAFRGKARALDCAGDRCCMITTDGTLTCWGDAEMNAAVAGATDVRVLAFSGGALCWSVGDAHEVWCASRAPSTFGTGMRDDPILPAPEARSIPLSPH